MCFDSGFGACGWMDNVVGLFIIMYNALQLYESYFWLADPMDSTRHKTRLTSRQQGPLGIASPAYNCVLLSDMHHITTSLNSPMAYYPISSCLTNSVKTLSSSSSSTSSSSTPP